MYVDAPSGPHESGLHVVTAFGSVEHVGTQFEVRLDAVALGVSVREGTVAVERAGARWTSRAGERMVLVRDRPPARQAIPTYGPDWSWVGEVARPFRVEGVTVPRFLDWASRELGLHWEYADPSLRNRVQQIVLHGSVEEMTA